MFDHKNNHAVGMYSLLVFSKVPHILKWGYRSEFSGKICSYIEPTSTGIRIPGDTCIPGDTFGLFDPL